MKRLIVVLGTALLVAVLPACRTASETTDAPDASSDEALPFWDPALTPPVGLEADGFRLEPLRLEHAEIDYRAFMGSQAYLYRTMGWGWPTPDVTLDQNREELAIHRMLHEAGRAFTFAVLTHDASASLGCVYLTPVTDALRPTLEPAPGYHAELVFWTTEAALEHDLDRRLFDALTAWMEAEWPFERVLMPIHKANARGQTLAREAGLHQRDDNGDFAVFEWRDEL